MLLISEDDRATVRSLDQLESEACDVIIVTCGASTFEVRGSNLRLFSLVGRGILRVAKFGSREKAPSPGSVYRDPPNKIAFGISGREGGWVGVVWGPLCPQRSHLSFADCVFPSDLQVLGSNLIFLCDRRRRAPSRKVWWRSSSRTNVELYDVTYSLNTSISCREPSRTSAAKDLSTASGGSHGDCSMRARGVRLKAEQQVQP